MPALVTAYSTAYADLAHTNFKSSHTLLRHKPRKINAPSRGACLQLAGKQPARSDDASCNSNSTPLIVTGM